MKNYLIIALLLVEATTISAQHSDMKMGQAEKPATLMSGLGSLNFSGSLAMRFDMGRASCA